jgi:hypothetical protein
MNINLIERHNQARWEGIEPVLVALSLAILLAVNLATSTRFPLPWQDEDIFADVAVNLATGQGFVSSVDICGIQSLGHLWTCNAPMFPFLLGEWIRAFGFTIVAVRSFNYLVFSADVFILWLAVRRLKLIAIPRARLLFVGLMLAGYGMGFIYRSARYDCLALLIASLALLAYSIRPRALRLVVTAGLGVMSPLIGIQLVCYFVVLGIILLLFYRTKVFFELFAFGVGAAIGGCLLLSLYRHFGVLQGFFSSLSTEHQNHFSAFSKDTSFFILLIAGVALLAGTIKNHSFRLESPLGIGLVAGLTIPLGMALLGKFPIYYSWMAYVPLTIAILAAASEENFHPSPVASRLNVSLMVLAALVGIPIQFASAAYYWNDRDCSKIDELVGRSVTAADWVYADYSAYFAVRSVTPHVFMPYTILARYRDNISVIIVSPRAFNDYAHAIVGGEWYDTGENIIPRGHDLLSNTSFAILLQRRIDLHVYKRITASH